MNNLNNQNDTQKTVAEQRSYLEAMSVYATSHPTLLNAFYKTEKLVTAIYMVTDMVDLNDTLKCRIRQRAMDAFDALYEVIVLADAGHQHIIRTALFSFEHTRSLLTIARNLGSISEMNYRILHKEIYLLEHTLDRLLDIDIAKHIQERRGEASASIGDFLEKAYQDIPEFTESSLRAHTQAKDNSVPHTQSSTLSPAPKSSPSPSSPSPQKSQPKTTSTTSTTSLTTSKKAPQKGETESRRNLIIEIINDKGEAMMKDIATRITNCTEKTLQRDLAYLIDNGHIVKEGKRRWSRYKLK